MIKLTKEREIAPMRGYIPTTRSEPAGSRRRALLHATIQAVLANIVRTVRTTASNVDSNDLR
jgi:hypothetical protein